jgi:hypothetical protein
LVVTLHGLICFNQVLDVILDLMVLILEQEKGLHLGKFHLCLTPRFPGGLLGFLNGEPVGLKLLHLVLKTRDLAILGDKILLIFVDFVV